MDVLGRHLDRIWHRSLGVGAVALGLGLTVLVAVRLIHRAEGYRAGRTDCDDCGLTLVLDHLGWLVVAVGAYLVSVLLVWWVLRRRATARQPRTPTPAGVEPSAGIAAEGGLPRPDASPDV